MKKKVISDAVTNISTEYVEKAADYTVAARSRKSIWLKCGAMAACFALVIGLSIPVVMNITKSDGDDGSMSDVSVGRIDIEDMNRPYKEVSISSPNMAVAWQWKYLTACERYPSINIDGREFIRLGEEISEDTIGEMVGRYEAVGYNDPYETPVGGYREEFDAYEIENISKEKMVALKMEDNYYCYISDEARAELRGKAWSDVFTEYGLSGAIELKDFSVNEGGREKEYFSLKADSYIWEVLSSASDAEFVDPSEWERDGDYYSFTITTSTFGIYKKAMYITEEGYLWTNMLDVACIYNIGKESAQKIMSYALENSEASGWKPYHKTIVGTITEITDDYFVIDDSVLCKDENDGMTFRIMLNDLRINRYVEDNRVKVGDIVEVVYKDTVCMTDVYYIDSAISASCVTLFEGDAVMPE